VKIKSFWTPGRILLVALCAGGSMGAAAAPKPKASAPAPKATVPSPASPAEKAIRERVEQYWKARATMNLQSVHSFYEPEFRTKYTADAFARDFRRLNRFAPEFQGVEAVTVDASGKTATVKVKLRTTPDILQGQELISVVEEVWLNVDGGWFKQSESLLPNI
jgi:hypothetical protein